MLHRVSHFAPTCAAGARKDRLHFFVGCCREHRATRMVPLCNHSPSYLWPFKLSSLCVRCWPLMVLFTLLWCCSLYLCKALEVLSLYNMPIKHGCIGRASQIQSVQHVFFFFPLKYIPWQTISHWCLLWCLVFFLISKLLFSSLCLLKVKLNL